MNLILNRIKFANNSQLRTENGCDTRCILAQKAKEIFLREKHVYTKSTPSEPSASNPKQDKNINFRFVVVKELNTPLKNKMLFFMMNFQQNQALPITYTVTKASFTDIHNQLRNHKHTKEYPCNTLYTYIIVSEEEFINFWDKGPHYNKNVKSAQRAWEAHAQHIEDLDPDILFLKKCDRFDLMNYIHLDNNITEKVLSMNELMKRFSIAEKVCYTLSYLSILISLSIIFILGHQFLITLPSGIIVIKITVSATILFISISILLIISVLLLWIFPYIISRSMDTHINNSTNGLKIHNQNWETTQYLNIYNCRRKEERERMQPPGYKETKLMSFFHLLVDNAVSFPYLGVPFYKDDIPPYLEKKISSLNH